jgi:hypothetical protein
VNRTDGDQQIVGLNIAMPPGVSMAVAGIPHCPEAAIARLRSPSHTGLEEFATPACPLTSQIGTGAAVSGPGSELLHNAGRVFLAGPYRGAPLSLMVAIPMVSGPYDLGTMAVRVALDVDPATAQINARSDPIPRILAGIPLRTRSIQVDLDRRDLVLNPTDCGPSSVDATAIGDEGGAARLSNHFQVANCAILPLAPRLGVKVGGATKRGGHPALQAVLRARTGDANLSSISVALPRALLLDERRIRTVCGRARIAAGRCAAGSRYGHALVETPLLDGPLSGPVYLRPSRRGLPQLLIDLGGQVDLELVGRIRQGGRGGIRASFEALPDVPVSKIVLRMQGGRKGLLRNGRDLCARPSRASVRLRGHNGRRAAKRTGLLVACRGPRGKGA